MHPVDFPERNKTLTKPEGWTDEQCSPLHIYSNGKFCYSVWRGTWRERLEFLFRGHIALRIHSGNTQPPVSLEIRKSSVT